MKPYQNFKARKRGAREKLPAGGYICRIGDAHEETYMDGNRKLVITLDIADGPYAGFFRKDYEDNDREDRKWRGNLRLRVPDGEDSPANERAKHQFENFAWSVQQSNPGYVWNWQEESLRGKLLGVIWRECEWVFDGGRRIHGTEACETASVQDVREGNYRVPDPRIPKKTKEEKAAESAASAYGPAGLTEEDGENGDLPFD